MRLVGKNLVAAFACGHKRNKNLRQGFGGANGKRIVGVREPVRAFPLAFPGRAVVQRTEIVISAKETRHLPYLDGELGAGLGVNVEKPGCRCQSVVGEGNERFRLAGTGCAEQKRVRQDVLGLEPQFPLVLKPVSKKEDAFGRCESVSAGERIALVRA